MNTSTLASLAVVVGLMLVGSGLRADAPPPGAKLAGVAEAIKPFIDQNEIAGAVMIVVSKDGMRQLEAIGEANRTAHAPMKTDALFWIASMTKPITGVAIMMMQDEGKLNVDDQVSKYIPEFANIKTPSGKPANLTLKHLLTHTSGLAEATGPEQKAAKTLADLIPHFVDKPTQFEPGSKWAYCQSGINTLGRIVEITSGMSLPEFFAKRITGPLGMVDTTFYPSKAQQARIAHSYASSKDGKLEEAEVRLFAGQALEATDRVPLANGGLYSTAADYGRFFQMILNGGSLDGKVYLKPESLKLMTSVQSGDVKTGFTPGNGWGLAWCVVREPQGVSAALSPGSAGHGGAYGTQAWVDFQKGVGYVLMVQRSNFPNSDASEVRKAFQDAAAKALK